MANLLKMAKIHAVIGLLEQCGAYRRIAREVGVDRGTVARYDHLRREPDANPTIPAFGSNLAGHSNPAIPASGVCRILTGGPGLSRFWAFAG